MNLTLSLCVHSMNFVQKCIKIKSIGKVASVLRQCLDSRDYRGMEVVQVF